MHVKLKVLRGASAGKEIVVRVTKFLIGRAEECHLRANSEALSRRHSAIVVDERDVRIRDLGSRNGTYVNGQRLEAEHKLQMGDQLRIGPLEFLVTFVAPAGVGSAAVGTAAVGTAAAVAGSTPSSATGTKKQGQDEMAGLISDWLAEADEADRKTRLVDTETRALRIDETDRIKVETGKVQTTAPTTPAPEAEPEAAPPADSPTTTFAKKANAKNVAPKDTQEAAAQTLRKFFNRGS